MNHHIHLACLSLHFMLYFYTATKFKYTFRQTTSHPNGYHVVGFIQPGRLFKGFQASYRYKNT